MQLFAYDNNGNTIIANQARKKCDYSCIECGSTVRRRGGMHRHDHFYHLYPNRDCQLSGKSLTHLQTQLWFQKKLPGGVQLERRFPSIRRVADVVWEDEKIIFEVQCSGITAEEVEKRNFDYSSEGYQVVWILHDRRFRRPRVTGAELLLRDSPHYYTNMKECGEGEIYDCFDLIQRGRREKRIGRWQVDVKNVVWGEERKSVRGRWKVRLKGDLFDHLEIEEVERLALKESQQRKLGLWQRVKGLYRDIFHMILEECCR